MTRTSLKADAQALDWGPTVFEPRSIPEALTYALTTWGEHTGRVSLGMTYAYKSLMHAAELEPDPRKDELVIALSKEIARLRTGAAALLDALDTADGDATTAAAATARETLDSLIKEPTLAAPTTRYDAIMLRRRAYAPLALCVLEDLINARSPAGAVAPIHWARAVRALETIANKDPRGLTDGQWIMIESRVDQNGLPLLEIQLDSDAAGVPVGATDVYAVRRARQQALAGNPTAAFAIAVHDRDAAEISACRGEPASPAPGRRALVTLRDPEGNQIEAEHFTDPHAAARFAGDFLARSAFDSEGPGTSGTIAFAVTEPEIGGGKWTLQIEGKIVGRFASAAAADNCPEAEAARAAGEQILLYGPDGSLMLA